MTGSHVHPNNKPYMFHDPQIENFFLSFLSKVISSHVISSWLLAFQHFARDAENSKKHHISNFKFEKKKPQKGLLNEPIVAVNNITKYIWYFGILNDSVNQATLLVILDQRFRKKRKTLCNFPELQLHWKRNYFNKEQGIYREYSWRLTLLSLDICNARESTAAAFSSWAFLTDSTTVVVA